MSIRSSTVNPVLTSISDEQLVLRARQSEPAMDEMMRRYYGFVRYKAQGYFLASGGDITDLVQEGLIGLYKAICDFNPEKDSKFRTFADICIARQIITAVKTATRKKHEVLNQAADLYSPPVEHRSTGGKVIYLVDMLATPEERSDPLLAVRRREMAKSYRELLKTLSDFEMICLSGLLAGLTYSEIGVLAGCDVKSADNALQRAKGKLRPLLIEFADVA